MNNKSNSNQNCCCGNDSNNNSGSCCTPPKSSLWKKIIFVVILLAVGAIITMKLLNKDEAQPANCCEKTENPSCCSQPVTDTINSLKPEPEE